MAKKFDILDYAKGKQRGKQAHRLERESLNDPFLADALEGFEQAGNHEQAIAGLRSCVYAESIKSKQSLPLKQRYKLKNYLFAVAAVALLALVISPFLYREVKHRQYLALFDEVLQAPSVDLEDDIIPITQAHLPMRKKLPHYPLLGDDVMVIVNGDKNVMLADNATSLQAETKQSNDLIESDLAIEEEVIPVQRKETLSTAQQLLAENKWTPTYQKVVKGKVLDEEGVGLPGAVVTQLGTKNTAMTDADGKFNLAIENFDKQLQASFMGYQPKAINLNPRDTSRQLFLALAPDAIQLNDVVVTGYGSRKSDRKAEKMIKQQEAVASAESKKNLVVDDEVYPFAMVEEAPIFMNSNNLKTFIDWVQENLVYPNICKENSIEGKVLIKFVIDSKGKLINAIIVKSLHPSLDAEALRVVNSSPLWIAGMQHGKTVSVECTIPVNFQLK